MSACPFGWVSRGDRESEREELIVHGMYRTREPGYDVVNILERRENGKGNLRHKPYFRSKSPSSRWDKCG